MGERSSFSQGLGIGCGIYTAFTLIAIAVPLTAVFLFCGGCVLITGSAARVASNRPPVDENVVVETQPVAIDAEPTTTEEAPPEFSLPANEEKGVEPGEQVEPLAVESLPPKAEPAPELSTEAMRTFTDKTGQHTTVAEFLEFKTDATRGSRVTLRKTDGKEIEVPMNSLSKDDQQWIRDEVKRRREPQPVVVTPKPVVEEKPEEPKPSSPSITAGISLANYTQVRTGMSKAEVIAILGSGFEILSEAELGGTRSEIYMWQEKRFLGGNCNVTFSDGKVIAKAQFGLK